MLKSRIFAVLILLAGFGIGYFVYMSEKKEDAQFPFRLGLDLSGGTHLIYRADVSRVEKNEVSSAMDALRDVIERRVNLFGVAEPVVQTEKTSSVIPGAKEERLIVELPGVTDTDKAIAMIGETPLLEFRLERPDSPEKRAAQEALNKAIVALANGEEVDKSVLPNDDLFFVKTELSGRYLTKAALFFDSLSGAPGILLDFNKQGADIFERITGENVGKTLAIYLDGSPISTPVIRQKITGGKAEITGQFTPEEAKVLVGRLNSGALPIPIELIQSQTVGASLGEDAKTRGVIAGIAGFLAASLFMIFWYRASGIVAIFSLAIYAVTMLSIFKLVPITLTAAGIAGFILSIGMAVDANILIFERTKEELKRGLNSREAVIEGFKRAWFSIRDSNLSSMITAAVLFWFGTSIVEGFALVFGLGVLVSMITSISISRTLLLAVIPRSFTGVSRFLFGSGVR